MGIEAKLKAIPGVKVEIFRTQRDVREYTLRNSAGHVACRVEVGGGEFRVINRYGGVHWSVNEDFTLRTVRRLLGADER